MSTSAASLARRREPANARDAMQPGMWVILLEIGLVIGLAAFIVWWTWPQKRDGEALNAERKDGDAER
jgi:hypothetical protein